MKIGNPRTSGLARTKLAKLHFTAPVWSPPPIIPKVRIRIETDYAVRVSLSPATLGVEDRVFDDPKAATTYAAKLMVEHAAEMAHD